MFKKVDQKIIRNLFILLIVFMIGLGFGRGYLTKNQDIQKSEKNTPKAFTLEIYDKIKENYWNNISDAELLDLFKLSIEKNGGSVTVAKFESREKLLEAINKSTAGMDEDQKAKFTGSVAGSVLASLSPQGRSGLYTEKQEEQLKNTVANINPEKDLYKDLELQKGASEAAILQAYQKKSEELSKDKSPEAKEKLKTITYARDTLTKKDTKEKYDQSKIEPTVFAKITAPGILYVEFKKFSPTSF